MTNTFSGKVVWVTGASSGIGEALVKAFAKEGAKIILSARREDELQRVKKDSGLNDQNSLVLPLDLYNIDSMDGALKKVQEKFSTIDILICNAGIAQRSMVKDSLLQVDRQIMELNFFSVIALTKKILPLMFAQKSGNIVVISSVMGKMGIPFRSMYCASKHALHGFFEALRGEVFKDNIKVNIICPGYVKTNVSLNAVTSEGKAHGKMDKGQEKGIAPEKCAAGILKAIRNNKEEVYIGGSETIAPRLKSIFPGLFSAIIKRVEFH
ncbi:MAG TPA: SDR family oxidoreductase [Bacteroidia bacterium]|jgi:short-subunit dehydrogenase|nr:SDR family oxidoreductase [Bacteroidia bacterium]